MKRDPKFIIEGPINKVLFKLTWPMVFGIMGIFIFNLIDTFFIGKLGVDNLAAISFTFPVVAFVGSVAMGIGIGAAAIVSKKFVSEPREEVRIFAFETILLALFAVFIVMIIGLNTINPVFKLLGAKPEELILINDFMSIWYFGTIFLVIPLVGNGIIRATGDTFTPGIVMMVFAIFNAALDPFLIFGIGPFPKLGIKGAAIATVSSRAMISIFCLYLLIKRDNLLHIHFRSFSKILNTWKKIFSIAGPSAIGLIITPLSIAIVTKIISVFGKEAVAAFGIVSKVELFGLILITALSSVMTIFTGQNFGMRNWKRLEIATRNTVIFSLIMGVFLLICYKIFARDIGKLFSTDTEVVEITVQYFGIVSFSYGFQGIFQLSSAIFNGLNKPLNSLSIVIIRMIVLYVPLTYILSRLIGIKGIFWGVFGANILVGIVSYIWIKKYIQRQHNLS
ncbi:MATE family efflux transporter [Aureivirga sp. CE67]|uniref:MATE family efflux transporter n=1 Tax=Aureivirga sp. CE67 TaxID=1788983 RepID=UPI0018C9BDCB|nr:MATE family efflux transporter [Aureivirga sp. CE67]